MEDNKYISKTNIVKYIFNSLDEIEAKKIDDFLEANEAEQEWVEGLIDICLDNNFNESQFLDYLNKSEEKLRLYSEEKIKELELEEAREPIPIWRRTIKTTLPIAASIVLFFIVVFNKGPKYPNILDRNQSFAASVRSDSIIDYSKQLYNSGRFEEITKITFEEKYLNMPELQLMLGLSYLQLNPSNDSLAMIHLKEATQLTDNKNDALFYLAQIYLHQDDKENCYKCTQEILQSSFTFSELETLERLNKKCVP